MADNIYTVMSGTLSTSVVTEIDLPLLDDVYENNSFGSTYNRNGVTYVFDGSHNKDILLLQENDVNGPSITIPASTYYVAGPWRRASGAPKYLIAVGSDTSYKLTVLKLTGASTCTFIYTKNI